MSETKVIRRRLQPRWLAFADLMASGGLSGTQAAIRVGYAPRTAAKRACALMKKERVRQHIERVQEGRRAALDADAGQTVARLLAIVRCDLSTAFAKDGRGRTILLDPTEWPADVKTSCQSVKVRRFTEKKDGEAREVETTEIRTASKIDAVRQLHRIVGGVQKEGKEEPRKLQELLKLFKEAQRQAPVVEVIPTNVSNSQPEQ
jgi:phage terminase small subunit